MKFLKRFSLFCLVGASGALIELIFFNIFYLFLIFALSKLLALIFALLFNFIINRRFTFSASTGKKRKQIPKYILVYSIAIVVNYFVSVLLETFLGGEILVANISVALGIIVAIPITFFGSNYYVFRE